MCNSKFILVKLQTEIYIFGTLLVGRWLEWHTYLTMIFLIAPQYICFGESDKAYCNC